VQNIIAQFGYQAVDLFNRSRQIRRLKGRDSAS
jgi:hypothetical protein